MKVKRKDPNAHPARPRLSSARADRRERRIVGAVFLALTAAACAVYLPGRLGTRPAAAGRPVLAAPSLVAGARGMVYAMLHGVSAADAGRTVTALLHLAEGAVSGQGALGADGTVSLVLDLHGVQPGEALLEIQAGDITARRRVAIHPDRSLRLWTACRTNGPEAAIEAIASARPVAPDGHAPGDHVAFSLFAPDGTLIGYREAPFDGGGYAHASHAFPMAPAPGVYTLAARWTDLERSARFPLEPGAPAAQHGTHHLLAPEYGVLIAGIPNRVRVVAQDGGPLAWALTVTSRAGDASVDPSQPEFTITPPGGAGVLECALRAAGAAGPPQVVRLDVRDACALRVEQLREPLVAGNTVNVTITGEPAPGAHVVELVVDGCVVASRIGLLEAEQSTCTLAVPAGLEGPCAVRVWPLADDAPSRYTWRAAEIRPREAPGVVAAPAAEGLDVSTTAGQSLAAVRVLAGDTPPTAAHAPDPVALSGLFTPTLALHAEPEASASERLWRGVLLLAMAALLFRSFAAILNRFRKEGLAGFCAVVFVVYCATVWNCRFLGTASLALGLFWIHRSFRAAFRVLPPAGRLGFRWAVPVLCLAPYLHLARAITPPGDGAPPRARVHLRRTTPANGALPAPALIPPGGAYAWANPAPESHVLIIARTGSGREHMVRAHHALAPQPRITVGLAPRMTAGPEGDRVVVPVSVTHTGNVAWTGTLTFDGGSRLACTPAATGDPVVIPPGETWHSRITVSARRPGEGSLDVTWRSAHGQGSHRTPVTLLAGGDVRETVVNAMSGAPHDAPPLTLTLPLKTLYGSAELFARFFPGFQSQLGTMVAAAPSLPWSNLEQAIAVSHACAAFLVRLDHSGEGRESETPMRAALAQALMTLAAYTDADGAVGGNAEGDRIVLTAQAVLMRRDLERVWPCDPAPREDACTFLRRRMRADGALRSGRLHTPPTDADVHATALAACALAEETPAPTQDFIRTQLRLRIADPEPAAAHGADARLVAPLLAAGIAAGALSREDEDRAARLIAGALDYGLPADAITRTWTAYAMARMVSRTDAHLEATSRALAAAAHARNREGAFRAPLAVQLYSRALLLCSRRGPRLASNDVIIKLRKTHDVHLARSFTPADPDAVHTEVLTQYLGMGGNQVQIIAQGSPHVPYQVVFRYAVPWEGRSPSPLADVSMSAPAAAIEMGRETAVAFTIANLSDEELRGARLRLVVPPTAALVHTGGQPLLSGTGTPGDVVLLGLPSVPARGTQRGVLTLRAVREGKCYIQPLTVWLHAEPAAHSAPGMLTVIGPPSGYVAESSSGLRAGGR